MVHSLVSKFNYDPIERETRDDGVRFYIDPVHKIKLPSITTVLSRTGDHSGIEAWANYIGKKKADIIRDEAAGIGSILHEHLENYLLNIPRPDGDNLVYRIAKKLSDSMIQNGLLKITEVYGIEAPLYLDNLCAGTSDLIASYDGEISILDFKNSRKIKKEEHLQDYFAQLAAYALCHDQMFGTSINQGVILMVNRDAEFKEFIVQGDEFESHKIKFLERLDHFHQYIMETL